MPETPESYDYVIVGAGSAGCVLANRLTEDADVRVLILEAGPADRSLFIHMPAGVYRVWKDQRFNWNYASAAEGEMGGREIPVPRGKVLGGSSSINSMVYLRGHPLDYDRWAAEFGLPAWDYAHCLPYFRKSERSERGANDWHGDSGPLGVSMGKSPNILYDVFVEAGAEAGVGKSDDLNGYRPEGLGRYDSTKWNGKRCSAAVAYLHPASWRSNLAIRTGAHVLGLDVEGNRVTGLSYAQGARTHRVRAEREVILSGGAINSPQLLMLSGIGPADELRRHGIGAKVDLPGVGQNLQDHIDFMMQWSCTRNVTLQRLANPFVKLAVGTQWMLNKSGPVSSNIWEAGGLVRTDSAAVSPNIQYHFGPVAIDYAGDRIQLKQGFQLHVSQLRQESRGRLELKSADPRDTPRIVFNFLATENDRREMVEGVRMARHIVSQPAFAPFRGDELYPGSNARSDAEVLDWVRSVAETEFHPSCTCRMGQDRMAVVDESLRVHGIDGLRVIDASVMPNVISANLNATVMMIAEKAADAIRGRKPLAPSRPRFFFDDQPLAASSPTMASASISTS
ncbi:choline dehydrogenase [Aestuariivirga sp.]|uniref:choline dehydrogenase n=1 Tax=Aestuariivirga sp. TaxID=2650926 RepID=UPI00391D0C16